MNAGYATGCDGSVTNVAREHHCCINAALLMLNRQAGNYMQIAVVVV